MRDKYYVWANTIYDYYRLIEDNKLNPKKCRRVNDRLGRIDGLRLNSEQLIGFWPERYRRLVTLDFECNQARKVIAVDFDGTIVESCFPDIGPIKPQVAERVREEKEKGSIIIIWTCRGGKELDEAIHFLKKMNVPFDYVNENPLNPYGDTTRKIFADEYWDDKAVRIL